MLQRLLAIAICGLFVTASVGISVGILHLRRVGHGPEMSQIQPPLEPPAAPRSEFTSVTGKTSTTRQPSAIKSPNPSRKPAESTATLLPVRTLYDFEILEIPPPSPPSARINWRSVEYRL